MVRVLHEPSRTKGTYEMNKVMPLDTYPIHACVFDFGGTLDSDGRTWQDRFYPIYLNQGVEVDRETFRQAFYYSDDTLIGKRALVDSDLRETLESQVSLVLSYLGLAMDEQRKDRIVGSFLEDMVQTVERNRGLLNRLSSRFRLGIVSNFYGNLERVCEDLGIRAFFEVLVDSTRVGAMKPDPRIFQKALEKLGIAPEQGLFVGDNQLRDMAGARAIGMPHVLLVAPCADAPQPCCPNDWIISSLLELEALLQEEPYASDQPPRGYPV